MVMTMKIEGSLRTCIPCFWVSFLNYVACFFTMQALLIFPQYICSDFFF